MTLSPEQLKNLAEQAVEFCEFEMIQEEVIGGFISLLEWPEPYSGLIPPLSPNKISGSFFENLILAPILLHLGQVEMEKLGFQIRCERHEKYYRTFIKDKTERDWQLSPVYKDGDNEFYVFWSAVIKSTGGRMGGNNASNDRP